MSEMPDSYTQLLDAVISQLEEMKTRGIAYVGVSPDTITGLKNVTQKPALKNAMSPGRAKEGILNASLISLRASPAGAQAVSEQLNAKENTVLSDLPLEKGAGPAMPSLDPAAKTAAFADLRQRAMACVKCEH